LIAPPPQLCSLIEQRLHLAFAVMIYLRAIGESMVVFIWRHMGKKKATVSKDLIKDCFVREVRVNYVATTTEQFKISGPEDIAAFSRSELLDNSRE